VGDLFESQQESLFLRVRFQFWKRGGGGKGLFPRGFSRMPACVQLFSRKKGIGGGKKKKKKKEKTKHPGHPRFLDRDCRRQLLPVHTVLKKKERKSTWWHCLSDHENHQSAAFLFTILFAVSVMRGKGEKREEKQNSRPHYPAAFVPERGKAPRVALRFQGEKKEEKKGEGRAHTGKREKISSYSRKRLCSVSGFSA